MAPTPEFGTSPNHRQPTVIPGIDREVAQSLVDTAHRTCPSSKALHGHIHIETVLV